MPTDHPVCPGVGRVAGPGGATSVVAVVPGRGLLPLDRLYRLDHAAADVLDVVAAGELDAVVVAAEAAPDSAFDPFDGVRFAAPYERPRKIWGIGLNYVEHAGDLSEKLPEEPASFLKGDHTVIGPGDPIPIPWQSERTTAEAEIGLVIGPLARDVPREDALAHVAGVVPVLDQTAEDILQRNPRFLTRSKNFPGFFSFGPWIVPLRRYLAGRDLGDVVVRTVLNGGLHRENVVAAMTYDPAFLVSFHSQVMPLYPGDIISTGTPGAVPVAAGDVAEARVDGLPALVNPVVDQPAPPS